MDNSHHLRRWQKGDELALVRYANNYHIWRNVRDAFPHPYTLEDARHWISMCESEKTPSVFAIEVDGEAVGCVGIVLQKDIFSKNAEIGYWLGEPFWGKGIITAAVSEVVEYAFRTFDIHRLYAGVMAHNPASMKVLEKAGFQLEAILKKSIYKENTFIDEHLYVRFREAKK